MSISDSRLLPDRAVSERYSVTTRTLDRWDNRTDMNFPKPRKINGRKYRSEDELNNWDAGLAAQARAT